MKMTKNYVQSLATQIMTGKDPEKHEKYKNKQTRHKQHSWHAVVSVLYFAWCLLQLHGNV
jgi:hypothetical protein